MERKKVMRAALYARCSTHDKGQDPELQCRIQRQGYLSHSAHRRESRTLELIFSN
jgi:hypothetical protein